VAYDDVVTAQVDIAPVVSSRTGADSTSVLVNLGTFTDSFEFTVPTEAVTDATFTISANGLIGVLSNATAALEVETDTGWVRLGDATQGGLLELTNLAGTGFRVGAQDLEAGSYRLTYGGGGLLGVNTTVNLAAQLTDTSLTNFDVVSAPAVTGSVFDASAAGPADELGAGTPVLQVPGEDGAFVTVTGPTEVNGQFGTLLINADGSFTYTPDVEAADIGQVDSFTYQLLGPDGASQATLNVRLDSPDADIIWDDTDFGAPGTTVVAVSDTAEAGIVLAPRVDDPETDPDAIGISGILTLGRVSDTYEFTVAPDTIRDLTLEVTSNSTLNLLGGTTFTLQRLVGTSWVNVTTETGGSPIELLGLTGGGIRAEAEDLGPGSYRLQVATRGLGLGTNVTGTATFVDTYPNEVEAASVVATSGNVLTGTGGTGGDVLGSEYTVLRIEEGDGVFVAPGYAGERITGDHGTLFIQANGDFTYTPFADDAGIGETDRFTYQVVHPNGQTSTAELAITIGEAEAGVPVILADVQPADAPLDLHVDVGLLDGLTALSVSDGHHAASPADDTGTILPVPEPGTRDPSQLELHGDAVVLVGLDDLPASGGSDDGTGTTIGSHTDGITLPAFEDLLEIEPQDAVHDDPPAATEETTMVHADTAMTVEIEPVVLIDNPLHDPWANAATHV
jgi:VCBS repeat-containing protein